MASENELYWLDIYIETGDDREAVRTAFPDCGRDSQDPAKAVAIRASQLKKKLALDIDKRLRESFSLDSVKIMNILRDLAINAESENVKLNAAKDWLDRGGYKPVQQTEDLTRDIRTIEDIDAEIEKLEREIAITEGKEMH